MKSELLEDIQEQKESVNLAIDSDSLLFLSCYALKDTKDLEAMYVDFWMRVKSIENEVWKDYEIDKIVIALTSKVNFRHDLTEKWKANRRDKDEAELTDKQIESQRKARELKDLVRDVKGLIYKRMNKADNRTVVATNIAEADDIIIDLAYNGWVLASIDSDVIKQSPTPVFNFHKKHWKWTDGNSDDDIFFHIIYDCLQGGHNDSVTVKGCGKVCATKFIKELEVGDKSFVDFTDMFDTPSEALLSYRLNDNNQVKNGKLRLITIEELSEKFEMYCGDKF